jgi:hypothetical protein
MGVAHWVSFFFSLDLVHCCLLHSYSMSDQAFLLFLVRDVFCISKIEIQALKVVTSILVPSNPVLR